jgi:hypothetical protein
MRRLLIPLALVSGIAVTALAWVTAIDAAPGDLLRSNNSGGNQMLVPKIAGTPCWRVGSQTFRPDGTPFSACTPTTSTTVAPTTTLASTTTSTATVAPTTTATTTAPLSGVQFVETFDGNTGLERFNRGVYHRDPHQIDQTQWQGDHDSMCGSPATSRTVHRNVPAESFYNCVDHMMTAMGDTSGYSVVWFSPAQVFPSVDSVSFAVNLTDLGARKWWKVGVVTDALYGSSYANFYDGQMVPGFLVSDVGASALREDLSTSDRLIATWSGQASAGWPGGWMKVGDNWPPTANANPTPTDKAARHPVSLVDNRNGTVTFTVAGVSTTKSGAFPACPCRVVFYDHNYTPNKSDPPAPVSNAFTWHWDSIVVR